MALQVTLSGTLNIAHGQQTVLTASVIDTDTGLAPTQLITYEWETNAGSFVGATDGASVTFLADIAGNTATTAEIACTVRGPEMPATVSSATLTSMDDLGITNQLVNILATVEIDSSDLIDQTDPNSIDSGSDTELATNLNIFRFRWSASNRRFLCLRPGGGASFRNFWDAAARAAYSGYLVFPNGSTYELLGDWITLPVGNGSTRWELPSSETALFNALESLQNGDQFVFGIADADSIGVTQETDVESVTINVSPNQPPVVSIDATTRVNPGDVIDIEATVTDPESQTWSGVWTGDGRFANTTLAATQWTAPMTPGDYTITFTVTDQDGQEGSFTTMIVVNSPPTVTLTVPSTADRNTTINVSAEVSDPNSDTVTVEWSANNGTFGNASALSTIFVIPNIPGTYRVTLTATDQYGAETVVSADIIVPNTAPTLSLNVPTVVNPSVDTTFGAVTGDIEGDTVTVKWSANGGSFDDDTSTTPVWTPPSTPGNYEVSCIATDQYGATTTMTADVEVNAPPTASIMAPTGIGIGEIAAISVMTGDPNNDTVTVRWETTAGRIDDPTAAQTTITAPDAPTTITVTLTATDEHGAETVVTVDINVTTIPPMLSLFVPTMVDAGQEVTVRAIAIAVGGAMVELLWDATGGSFADDAAEQTIWTAPPEPGNYEISCLATDEHGAEAEVRVQVEVTPPPIAGGLLIVQPVSIDRIQRSVGFSSQSRLFDGNPATEATVNRNGAHITLDMGSAVEIGAIRIKTEPNSPLNLVWIQPSDSTTSFPEVDRSNYAPTGAEWHVYRFGNIRRRYWRLRFLRRGTSNYQIAQIEFYRVVAPFDSEETRPASLNIRQYDPRATRYRRYDRRLVSNNSPALKTELRVNWVRLAQEHVDALDALYQSGERFTVIPDVEFAPDKSCRVRWASPFAFVHSTRNWTLGKSGQAVFQEVHEQLFKPVVQIEIEGQDVTDRWDPNDGIRLSSSLDQQKLFRFHSAESMFALDNFDRQFDYSNPTNFFLQNALPAHGRGAKVLIKVGLSEDSVVPMFAGIITKVSTHLNDTKAQFALHDLSVPLSQNAIDNFGQALTRKITDYDDAAVFYSKFNPVFNIPFWGLPISRGSVSAYIMEDGNRVDLNIVDAIAVQGTLSNRNIEIDYTTGQIRFEAEPKDGEAAEITVTWKTDYRYQRPDRLVQLLLEQAGITARVGISNDARARFALERSLVRHSDSQFSSNGRPYVEADGVVRWMRLTSAGTWDLIQDNRLVEYDAASDKYTRITTLPEEAGLEGTDSTGFGTLLTGESLTFRQPSDLLSHAHSMLKGLAATENRLYFNRVNPSRQIVPTLLDGTVQLNDVIDLTAAQVFNPSQALSVYDNHIYTAVEANTISLRVFDLATNQRVTSREFSFSAAGNFQSADLYSMDVKSDGIYFLYGRESSFSPGSVIWQLRFYDLDGNRVTSKETGLTIPAWTTPGSERVAIARNSRNLFFIGDNQVTTYTIAQVRDSDADFSLGVAPSAEVKGAAATENRLYVLFQDNSNYFINAYTLGGTISLGRYVPYQFDAVDDDELFFLCTNNTQGNAISQSGLNKVKGFKYVKSTDTWTELLNETTGQPQISEAYKINGQTVYLANNRKNSQVVRHNSETLWFFRRAQATQSGIAYYNDADGSVTDIYTESHSGSEDFGLPYSMDFALDVRSDGIYVYTFVVRHTLDATGNYTGGTLKVYRKRVEPSGSQTEIYSETFTQSSGEEDYPVSVSGVILADNRSKFYFVLDFHGEAERPGKAELCTIGKGGSGSRTVIKTYDNPLVGPRSPVENDGIYFYLEGGWVRAPKDDPPADDPDAVIPDDQHHYPNEGGRLIEVLGTDGWTDHGQVWRSATILESPDPGDEDGIYDGYGLHNSAISNMEVDSRGNLNFVAGYGPPYNTDENLPFTSRRGPAPFLSNYHWLQWGQDLATKIVSFPTTDAKSWDLIQRLAEIMSWEVGFGPAKSKVDSVQSSDPTISDWSANASLFFRPRTILPARLRTPIPATGMPSSIELNDNGLPAEMLEFPDPPSGERHTIIIDKELFSYTTARQDTNGVVLSGITRSVDESVAAAHVVDALVYFVDAFVSGVVGTSLVALSNRAPGFLQLFNNINVGFGDRLYNAKNQFSIDEHGEIALNIDTSQPLLSAHDAAWAEVAGETYKSLLSEVKELIQFSMVFSPSIRSGQLIVFHQTDRITIEYTAFRVLRVNHNIPAWQTQVVAKEI